MIWIEISSIIRYVLVEILCNNISIYEKCYNAVEFDLINNRFFVVTMTNILF